MDDKQLQELREKYGENRRPPDPDCQNCGGNGEYWQEAPEGALFKSHMTPCSCIFFAKEDRGWITGMIRDVAKAELKKLRGE